MLYACVWYGMVCVWYVYMLQQYAYTCVCSLLCNYNTATVLSSIPSKFYYSAYMHTMVTVDFWAYTLLEVSSDTTLV